MVKPYHMWIKLRAHIRICAHCGMRSHRHDHYPQKSLKVIHSYTYFTRDNVRVEGPKNPKGYPCCPPCDGTWPEGKEVVVHIDREKSFFVRPAPSLRSVEQTETNDG